ncbi:MAG TPA: cupin domain-containing protein [Chloroflexota bacterium]|jgi:quercetin dioxygenase-like cupin family protein|nr:cupin domain-containing protein [Chloroflexota bacterium]
MSDVSNDYFRTDAGDQSPDPAFPPLFVNVSSAPLVELSPGVRARPVFGRNLLINHVYFEPNAVAPVHRHLEEQIGLVLEGEVEFELAGERRLLQPGDIYVAPPYVPHGARTYEQRCVVLDVFAPPRSGMRELVERTLAGQQTTTGGSAEGAE